MCCGSYRGRLKAIELFLWLHGSAEYIKMGIVQTVGLRCFFLTLTSVVARKA